MSKYDPFSGTKIWTLGIFLLGYGIYTLARSDEYSADIDIPLGIILCLIGGGIIIALIVRMNTKEKEWQQSSKVEIEQWRKSLKMKG